MTTSRPVFAIEALQHVYGGATVLDIDRLSIARGAIAGLVGPNGSGKSTLLRLLGCIERPSAGRIAYNGQPIRPFAEAARFQISLLPQEPFLMQRSVFNNVCYGLKLRGESENATQRVHDALAFVGLPAEQFAGRPWYALSGGEAQRVALAARLVLRPKVLLLDEPTANVDAASAELIKTAALRARQEWDTTIVVASHDLQWLYEVCDDRLHLFRGRVLDTRHETVVLGPWKRLSDGRYAKVGEEVAPLIVTAPPDRDAAAVIHFYGCRGDQALNSARRDMAFMTGTIRRLTQEKRSGKIIATVMAGDLAINVALTAQHVRDKGLYPGTTLAAGYRLDEIKWI